MPLIFRSNRATPLKGHGRCFGLECAGLLAANGVVKLRIGVAAIGLGIGPAVGHTV